MTKEDAGKRIASKADLITDNEALRMELKRLQKDLYEAIKTQRTNAWKIQQQAFRGMKYAQKENTRLREALGKIIERAEKEESKASNATYGFAYDVECIARDALKGGAELTKGAENDFLRND